MNSSKKKQEFQVDTIKTPDGHVPTVESFHKVVDGLFGEVLDTRKDVAKLIPNLEKELKNLREILAQQMVLFEVINDEIQKLQKNVSNQGKTISKLEKTVELTSTAGGFSEAELTAESRKAIAKVIRSELLEGIKPLERYINKLEKDIAKSKTDTLASMRKSLDTIKDQIEDLSSKTELQMLEILESVNLDEEPSVKRTTTKSKKKLTS